MRGVSGAHVTISGSVATKAAPAGPTRERLHAQCHWLREHHTAPVVQVNRKVVGGYDMEVLHEWGHIPFPAARLIAPAEKLWSRPAEVELDLDAHQDWVNTKFNVANEYVGIWHLIEEACDLWAYVRNRTQHLTRCLTHGDLTRVNTMARHAPNGRVDSVLIDPIPATPACADVWVFDVSKMFVSLLGYEHVAYGWSPPDVCDRLWISELMMRMNPVEVECVRYMGVVQVARMLPYHPEEMHDGLTDIARQALRLRP